MYPLSYFKGNWYNHPLDQSIEFPEALCALPCQNPLPAAKSNPHPDFCSHYIVAFLQFSTSAPKQYSHLPF